MNKKWKEDVKFVVRVKEAKPNCRAGHNPGDVFEFDYNTPEGMCTEAFYTIYPMIHAMRMKADLSMPTPHPGRSRQIGPDAIEAYCPDNAWVKFEIQRIYQEGEGEEKKPPEKFKPDLSTAK